MLTRRLLAAIAAAGLTLAGCGGGGDTTSGGGGGGQSPQFDLVNEGTLTVCSDIPYPPMEMEAENGYTGFDIELMRSVSEDLGLEMQVKDVGFEGLQSGATLAAGTCDVAASSMTITDERDENLDFSDPYFDANQSLLVPEDSNISDIEDLDGRDVGVQQGTTGQSYAEENAPEDANIIAFPSDAELSSAIAAGQIEAILQDIPPNEQHVQESNPIPSKIVATFQTNENYGFAVEEEGSEQLLNAINDALETLRNNGTYEELRNEFFTSEAGGGATATESS